MVFDRSGSVIAIEQREHTQLYPKPGWVEHDPLEIWARCREVIDGALAKAATNTFRRTYFINEAHKLQRFEPVLAEADHVLAISPKDEAYFGSHFHNVVHIPAFHAVDKVAVPDGLGDFAFYHGALGVPENDQAALFLVRKVFKDLDVKLVIAGSEAYRGAAQLCLMGASASGAGSLRAALPHPVAQQLWSVQPHVVLSARLACHPSGSLDLGGNQSVPAQV